MNRTSAVKVGLSAILALGAVASTAVAQDAAAESEQSKRYAKTFDAHWEIMEKDYAYFELYGVD
jgi:uncharacterized membrane protein